MKGMSLRYSLPFSSPSKTVSSGHLTDTTTAAEPSSDLSNCKKKLKKTGKKGKDHPWDPHGTGQLELPRLSDINDKATYNMWKGVVNSFLNTGVNKPHLLPYVVSSLQGEVGRFVWTLGEISNLRSLLKSLDGIFKAITDLDTMRKGFYSLQQGPHETVTKFGVQLGFALVELTNTFPSAIPKADQQELK